MARFVREIMNKELVATRLDEPPHLTRDTILALGITAMPVLDDDRRPIGIVSLRDFVATDGKLRITSPARTVSMHATIEDAARALAASDLHHLIVVDDAGRAVGFVSCVDLVRALVGLPARHPPMFPHFDASTGVAWSDDDRLDEDRLGTVPADAGIVILVRGGLGRSETPVWAEACADLRARLAAMVRDPSAQPPELARILAAATLRFRVAVIAEASERARVLTLVSSAIGAR